MIRSDSKQWTAQKAVADEAEIELCELLASWGCVAGVQSIGHAPGADVAAVLTIEVKADGKAGSTGNAAIEMECRGRASGLQTTRAALWAIRACGEWFIVPVPTLKRLASAAPVVGAAEANRVALVPLAALRPAALVVKRGAVR
jgi:hypothetical protein